MREVGLRVDIGTRQVVVDERAVHLTASQFKLLALLTETRGGSSPAARSCTGSGTRPTADDHVCDVHVSNLRHKIERDPRNPERIVTVRGMGYRAVAV